jgi:hypothetical protein
MGSRGQFDLVGHRLLRWADFVPGTMQPANNWIVPPDDPKNEWMRSVMLMIGDWRATLRSTYIRWAMTINGLHVAAEKYRTPQDEAKAFHVRSLRSDRDGNVNDIVLSTFTFPEAAEAHLKIQPMLCAHGFVDMYAGLDEMVFAFYRTFLTARPELILQGEDFRELRSVRRAAGLGSAEQELWERSWAERLDHWQRKKGYDGLHRVFKAFCDIAGLQTPSRYTRTTIDTWAESIEGIGLVRNAMMHGVTKVSKDLADFCERPHALGFEFAEGESLILNLRHLQSVEAFCDQLLTGLNLSLVEAAKPEARALAEKRLKQSEAGKTESQ